MERYAPQQRWMHWIVAGLVAVQLGVGWMLATTAAAHGSQSDLERLGAIHGGTGALIFILMLVRLRMRRRLGVPPPPAGTPETVSWLARANHRAFYVMLLAQPILGWMAASASGLGLSIFGLVSLPNLVATDPDSALALGRLHGAVAVILLLLIAAHLAGVIYHSFVRGDRLLTRMTG